jgi:hypothetical protein
MSVKTQGTELFLADATATTPGLLRMTAPTGITGLGGASDQIETTNLDDLVDRQYVRGLGNPGQVSVPFVLKPTDASHKRLIALQQSGDVLQWMVCLSDGTADPTYSSGTLTPPASRTSLAFLAYVSDVSIDVATNEVVRGTLSLQRSGAITTTWKS